MSIEALDHVGQQKIEQPIPAHAYSGHEGGLTDGDEIARRCQASFERFLT